MSPIRPILPDTADPSVPRRTVHHCPRCNRPRRDYDLLCPRCWDSLTGEQRIVLFTAPIPERVSCLAQIIREGYIPAIPDCP